MAHNFVGGVRDTAGRRGYVALRAGAVAAVDLASGRVMWNRAAVGRPVAATAEWLLTLDVDGSRYVLRLLDAKAGADLGRIEDFGMPDWAAQASLAPDALQIDATEIPEGVRVTWTVRRPYRGGAPPPEHIAAQALAPASGNALIDPMSARVLRIGTGAPDLAPHSVDPDAQVPMPPGTVAQSRIGDRVFALKAEPRAGGALGVTLEARDAQGGAALWETPLADLDEEAKRPMPLRPTPGPIRR